MVRLLLEIGDKGLLKEGASLPHSVETLLKEFGAKEYSKASLIGRVPKDLFLRILRSDLGLNFE